MSEGISEDRQRKPQWNFDRRTMDLLAYTSDFHRQIVEQVCNEMWQSHDAGKMKFGCMAQRFLAQKKKMGATIQEDRFCEDLKAVIVDEAHKQIASKSEKKVLNGEFLKSLAEEIPKVAAEYEWFSANLLWEV